MLENALVAVLLLVMAYGLFSGIFGLFSDRGFSAPVTDEGVADAIELARSSQAVRDALGEEWSVVKVALTLRQDDILERTTRGAVYVRGEKGAAKIEFDYKRVGTASRGDATRHLSAKLVVGKVSVDL